MAATTAEERQAQRNELVEKVEREVTHRADLGGKGMLMFFRVLLQDLPYDGAPSLLEDVHRQAIDRLVERASRHDIRIVSIVGHTSEPGTPAYNQDLAERRAQAVFDHMLQSVETSGLFTDNTLLAGVQPTGRGEMQPAQATPDQSDHPLNRRVEIAYRLKTIYPLPADAAVPRSRFWKVDFSAGADGFVLEAGAGTLTMLPDDETGQADNLTRPLTYESLGVALGIAPYLKKLRVLKRFPAIRKLVAQLDPHLPGHYVRTEKLLKEVGFEVDLASEGGEFMTQEALGFEEMSRFNYASVSASLALGAGATGSLLMLHSPYFFGYTVLYGASMAVSVPDASLEFVPAAWVQVHG